MNVSFRTKLLASYVGLALLVSAATFVIVDRVVSRRLELQVDRRMEAQARSVMAWLERAGHPNQLAKRLADVVGARVSFVDREGATLGDSLSEASAREAPHSPEIVAAMEGEIGRATRYAEWAQQPVRHLAIAGEDGTVVRLGVPIGDISETQEEIRGLIAIGALASSFIALLLAVLVARPLSRRLGRTTEMATRLGRGEWSDSDTADAERAADDEIGVLSKTLAAAARELQEAEERRREFLSNIAHEIRTPVTSIQGYAQTLQGGDVPPETQGEFLQTIHRNSLRIGKLMEDLLELEALEQGTGRTLDEVAVKVSDVFRQARTTLAPLAEETRARFDARIEEDAVIRGDAEALERILLNLVQNSLHYGGEGVRIVAESKKSKDRLQLFVGDDGPGLDEEQRARIFQRFVRGSSARQAVPGGTGLGLPIARQLAQRMGGSLRLVEREGLSLCFCLELPAVGR